MRSADSLQNINSGILEKKNTITFFENLLNAPIYFTPSCTTALELAAIAIEIKPGDEVIIPSYTFVGTANAFAKLGATIVFIDIEPNSMCIDIRLLERSITTKTKAIVPVHYAGNSCNMQAIIAIAKDKGIYIIEDAAQCIFSYHQQKHLGTFGDIGCISFDYAKNIQCEQGGLVIINNPKLIDKVDKAFHNGTNKKDFLNGVSKNFEWQTLGSNFVLSDVHFSILYPQILNADSIQINRKTQWKYYYDKLLILDKENYIQLQPELDEGNAHIFYFKTKNRAQLLKYLHEHEIEATFHYVPLHSSTKGKQYQYITEMDYTTTESKKLVRLPIGIDVNTEKQNKIIELLFSFFR